MKVVLFCGGLGTRLKERAETVPKPLVEIGPRPIIWHLMRYYAHFGHVEFILCLGYKGEMIKDYFLNYNECRSSDFSLNVGGRKIELLDRSINDWKITFVDTGLHSNIGQRLSAVREFVSGEETFLANYCDGLSDFPLDQHIERFVRSDAVATFMSVRPPTGFHAVESGADSNVTSITTVTDYDFWVNGGFFVMRREIFDYIEAGEELVEEPFRRLIAEGKLRTWKYTGFWEAMDTYKNWIDLERLYHVGDRPWDMQWSREKRIETVKSLPLS